MSDLYCRHSHRLPFGKPLSNLLLEMMFHDMQNQLPNGSLLCRSMPGREGRSPSGPRGTAERDCSQP